jgi:hypothetical protein
MYILRADFCKYFARGPAFTRINGEFFALLHLFFNLTSNLKVYVRSLFPPSIRHSHLSPLPTLQATLPPPHTVLFFLGKKVDKLGGG